MIKAIINKPIHLMQLLEEGYISHHSIAVIYKIAEDKSISYGFHINLNDSFSQDPTNEKSVKIKKVKDNTKEVSAIEPDFISSSLIFDPVSTVPTDWKEYSDFTPIDPILFGSIQYVPYMSYANIVEAFTSIIENGRIEETGKLYDTLVIWMQDETKIRDYSLKLDLEALLQEFYSLEDDMQIIMQKGELNPYFKTIKKITKKRIEVEGKVFLEKLEQCIDVLDPVTIEGFRKEFEAEERYAWLAVLKKRLRQSEE